jgi:hypothetical protein
MSLAAAAAAFELLDANSNTPIAENIIYLGMRSALDEVMSGNRRKKRRNKSKL